jgi:hypothetical protein
MSFKTYPATNGVFTLTACQEYKSWAQKAEDFVSSVGGIDHIQGLSYEERVYTLILFFSNHKDERIESEVAKLHALELFVIGFIKANVSDDLQQRLSDLNVIEQTLYDAPANVSLAQSFALAPPVHAMTGGAVPIAKVSIRTADQIKADDEASALAASIPAVGSMKMFSSTPLSHSERVSRRKSIAFVTSTLIRSQEKMVADLVTHAAPDAGPASMIEATAKLAIQQKIADMMERLLVQYPAQTPSARDIWRYLMI